MPHPLVNMLGGKPGTTAEKDAWLERELDHIEAHAEWIVATLPKTPADPALALRAARRRTVLAFYRRHLSDLTSRRVATRSACKRCEVPANTLTMGLCEACYAVPV